VLVCFSVLIYPHGRGAANCYRHDDKVNYRNHRKQGDRCAEGKAGAFGLIEGKLHVREGHLVVIEGVVTILNGHHPGAEQEPDNRGRGLTEQRDPEQNKADDGSGQIVFKLYPFPSEYPWQIFYQVGGGAGVEVFARQVLLHFFGEQAVKGGGYPVHHRAEDKRQHH